MGPTTSRSPFGTSPLPRTTARGPYFTANALHAASSGSRDSPAAADPSGLVGCADALRRASTRSVAHSCWSSTGVLGLDLAAEPKEASLRSRCRLLVLARPSAGDGEFGESERSETSSPQWGLRYAKAPRGQKETVR